MDMVIAIEKIKGNEYGWIIKADKIRYETIEEKEYQRKDNLFSISIEYLPIGKDIIAFLKEESHIEVFSICNRGCCFESANVSFSNYGWSWNLNKEQYEKLFLNCIEDVEKNL